MSTIDSTNDTDGVESAAYDDMVEALVQCWDAADKNGRGHARVGPYSLRIMRLPVHHGTPGAYTNHGCRCDECRTAWAKYMSKYRHSVKAGE